MVNVRVMGLSLVIVMFSEQLESLNLTFNKPSVVSVGDS